MPPLAPPPVMRIGAPCIPLVFLLGTGKKSPPILGRVEARKGFGGGKASLRNKLSEKLPSSDEEGSQMRRLFLNDA